MKRSAYILFWITVILWLTHSAILLLDGALRFSGAVEEIEGGWAATLLEAAVLAGLMGSVIYAKATGVHGSVLLLGFTAGGLLLISVGLQVLVSGAGPEAPYNLSLAQGMRHYLAYPLAAVALGFWLARRFSRLPEIWFQIGIYIAGGVILLAGVLLTLADLYPFAAASWITDFTTIAAFLIPLLLLIYARHAYAPLANRSDSPALAAHWAALCLLLLLWGMGLAGSITAPVVIRQWIYGTRLMDLQPWLTLYAVLAMALGGINQAAMELRGLPRRVTGLMPFWLMSFGLNGLGITWLLVGTGQLYLGRMAGLAPQGVNELTRLLYIGQVIAAALMLLGAAIYALQLWVRRPNGLTNRANN
ncbi:MAG: hypothetical protein J0M33_03715 [Anaerolineae bacterium]|nr:hypothetical protein [Anaerolineae bacterium]